VPAPFHDENEHFKVKCFVHTSPRNRLTTTTTGNGSRLAVLLDMSKSLESLPQPAQRLSDVATSSVFGARRSNADWYRERALDDALAASFPASDPPSATSGTAIAVPVPSAQ
jgi:hypothetical protein